MKRIDIEHLVRWAYRDELPKVAAHADRYRGPVTVSGGEVLARLGELHTLVQEQAVANRYGVLPLLAHGPYEPHPDALVVAEAVQGLDSLVFDLPDGWSPLQDMGDLGPDGDAAVRQGLALLTTLDLGGRPRLRRPLSRLVMRHALLGGAPCWEADIPERRQVMEYGRAKWFRRMAMVTDGAFGPTSYEVEVDGFDHKRRRPYADAYRKFVLVPDPSDAVVQRAEYELWHAALNHLADVLSGRLEAHDIQPLPRPPRPWEAVVSGHRILPSLLVRAIGENENAVAA